MGLPGVVSFGAGALSVETLDEHGAKLASIGRALVAGGVLLPGKGGDGAAFVDASCKPAAPILPRRRGLVGAAARRAVGARRAPRLCGAAADGREGWLPMRGDGAEKLEGRNGNWSNASTDAQRCSRHE